MSTHLQVLIRSLVLIAKYTGDCPRLTKYLLESPICHWWWMNICLLLPQMRHCVKSSLYLLNIDENKKNYVLESCLKMHIFNKSHFVCLFTADRRLLASPPCSCSFSCKINKKRRVCSTVVIFSRREIDLPSMMFSYHELSRLKLKTPTPAQSHALTGFRRFGVSPLDSKCSGQMLHYGLAS